jgi:hypothetical protein
MRDLSIKKYSNGARIRIHSGTPSQAQAEAKLLKILEI